jgi:hypothetical protein
VSEKGYNIRHGLKRKTPKPSECKKIVQLGKHRYLYALDEKMKQQIIKLSKPYPKRVEHENNAGSFHDPESGAVPTNALQLKS